MASDSIYDVFLSHSSRDKSQVEELARRLKRRKLKPFLDRWHLVPGEPWQEALEEALDQSRTVAIFLGPGDLGPWHNEEMRDALDTRARDKSRRVIPILLPGASMPEKKALPRFLRRLTWVDFRGGLDDPQALHRLVSGIKGIPPEGTPALAPPHPLPTMIGVPHRNPFFTGREALLSRLHDQLQAQGISALAQAAICGLGGIGKTQTAIEYVHRFGRHYRVVLWAVAEEETALRSAYLSIARELGLADAQTVIESAVLAVKGWLARQDDWLLVFDNADDPSLVRAYLPAARTGGKVLLTSRAKSFVKVGIREPFRVESLDSDNAVKFLTERTGNADTQDAATLAAELGYLPLALEQAAAYIETVGGGFAEYLTKYQRQGLALLAKGRPSTDYLKTVATTWTLSFEAVRMVSPASAELLTAAVFLVPDAIPIEIFTRGASELGSLLANELRGADEDPLVFWELLEPLERYSLVERLPDHAFKLHHLTQQVIMDSLGEERRKALAERVIRALNAAYPDGEFESWDLCEKLQPHARLAYELARTYRPTSSNTARLFNQAGYYAEARGDHHGARLFLELSLEIEICILGGEHLETLTPRNNLGVTLVSLGDLSGAKQIFEHILEIQERTLGSEHLDTVRSRNNLGETLKIIGDLAGARKLHEQNLHIFERVLGGEHISTLTARNNLANTLRASGKFARVRQLHEQNVEMAERLLGDEHPITLRSKSNLAHTLMSLGDIAGARKLHEQTLEIRERVLGGEHPDTLHSMNHLAGTLADLGDLIGARKLLVQTLEIRECVLGSEHPDTLHSRNDLAATLYELGDLEGARKLHEQNLETRERVLGKEHSETLRSSNNLAQTLRSLGDAVGAKTLEEPTLDIQERVLGDEHPDTCTSRNNLAMTLRTLGDLASARKLHEQNLQIFERVLGREHPGTTRSTWNLFCITCELNDPDAAAQLVGKLQWLLDRDEDSIPSATQRTIRQALLGLLNPS